MFQWPNDDRAEDHLFEDVKAEMEQCRKSTEAERYYRQWERFLNAVERGAKNIVGKRIDKEYLTTSSMITLGTMTPTILETRMSTTPTSLVKRSW